MPISVSRGSGITQTGWTSPASAYDAGSGTFASWASTTANQTNTIYITGFNFDNLIPPGARIIQVDYAVKQYVSQTNRMLAPTIRPYVGATTAAPLITCNLSATTSNIFTATQVALTRAELQDPSFQINFTATHYNGTISGTQFLDYIELTVKWTLEQWGVLDLSKAD